jgi:hypothetical protein
MIPTTTMTPDERRTNFFCRIVSGTGVRLIMAPEE